jgi:predicted O-linked N-acetylglucosamine transferase (SPINDLY family)
MARFAAIDDPLTHFRLASQKSELVASQTKSLSRPSVPRIARGVIKERLRIGYISNDLNNNVMSLLIAGILEQHNRDRFEVTVYDYSREDGSPLRQRIMKAPEHFVAITKLSTEQCAEKVSLDEVDVLVDLKGHFYGARSDILALRPAPVQVNFLGFVGTHASNWIDYVIADRQVLPVAERINWTERVIYMPHSYFPNDRSRPVPREPIPGVRTKFGLPEAGIVFACFNSPHKITPGVFALWMRILRELPDSVLWLVATEQCIIVNLREQAMYAGVLPHRLVFAPKVSFADHIERHSYADIWLDTMYNGHTTAADSLWSGLPVVTLCGRSFAARVGASLLNAVGLPELICNTPDDYVKLAIELALDAEKRRTLRDHLVAARDASPLFDASRFARDLERAFTAIASKNRAGLKPENIYLTPQSDLME